MGKFILTIIGSPATGKSTRVLQIIKFVEEYLGGWVDYSYHNKEDGKDYVIGMYNEQLDIIIVGKLYYSGKVQRFQGHDAMTGKFGSNQNFSDWLKEISIDHNVIVEGFGVLKNFRTRPVYLSEYCGFSSVMNLIFHHEKGKDQYFNRVKLRSGKFPKSETSLKDNNYMPKFYSKSVEESKVVKIPTFIELLDADTDVNYIGVKLFETFYKEVPALVDIFKKFVVEFNYIEQNKFENLNA